MNMMYTLPEILNVLKERYEPTEILEILKIDVEDLVDGLSGYIEDNFEKVHENMLDDEYLHFGRTYGEDDER